MQLSFIHALSVSSFISSLSLFLLFTLVVSFGAVCICVTVEMAFILTYSSVRCADELCLLFFTSSADALNGNHDKSMRSMFSFLINSKISSHTHIQNISSHSEVLLNYINRAITYTRRVEKDRFEMTNMMLKVYTRYMFVENLFELSAVANKKHLPKVFWLSLET